MVEFFGIWISNYPSTSCWRDLSFSTEWFWNLVKIIWPQKWRFISGLSILFHWFVCLSPCQHHTFDPCSLMRSFLTGKWVVFKVVLAVLGPWESHTNFKMGFSISIEIAIGAGVWEGLRCHLTSAKSPKPWVWDACLFRFTSFVVTVLSPVSQCTHFVPTWLNLFLIYSFWCYWKWNFLNFPFRLLMVYRNTTDLWICTL